MIASLSPWIRAASERARHGRVVGESQERVIAAARRLSAQSACLDVHAHSLAAAGRRLDDLVRESHDRRLQHLDVVRARVDAVSQRTARDAGAAVRSAAAIAGGGRRAAAGWLGRAAEPTATVLAGIRAHDPAARGYAVVRVGTRVIRRVADLRPGQRATIEFSDGRAEAAIESVHQAREE